MITIWSIFRDLINSRPIGILVTRYEIMSTIQGELSKFSKTINFSECTVDTMRNMSEKTGYLAKTEKSGVYKVTRHFNKTFTTSKLRTDYAAAIKLKYASK